MHRSRRYCARQNQEWRYSISRPGQGARHSSFAAMMENRGVILACDVRGPALEQLEVRAARARDPNNPYPFARHAASDRMIRPGLCRCSRAADRGTWRRQPELKWRLTSARLAELTRVQDALLDRGLARSHPAGALFMRPVRSCPVRTRIESPRFLPATLGLPGSGGRPILARGASAAGCGAVLPSEPFFHKH